MGEQLSGANEIEPKRVKSSDYEVFKFISLRGKNYRKILSLHKHKTNPADHYFYLHTKKLMDWKTRNIVETNTTWSLHSILELQSCFDLMLADPEVKKELNREMGQIAKNKPKASTNCAI